MASTYNTRNSSDKARVRLRALLDLLMAPTKERQEMLRTLSIMDGEISGTKKRPKVKLPKAIMNTLN